MVMAFAAVSEVIVSAMSPLVVIAQDFRAAILVFFYFQYVARKHASNFWTKQAVTALNDKLTGAPPPLLATRALRARSQPAGGPSRECERFLPESASASERRPAWLIPD